MSKRSHIKDPAEFVQGLFLLVLCLFVSFKHRRRRAVQK